MMTIYPDGGHAARGSMGSGETPVTCDFNGTWLVPPPVNDETAVTVSEWFASQMIPDSGSDDAYETVFGDVSSTNKPGITLYKITTVVREPKVRLPECTHPLCGNDTDTYCEWKISG